jgi:hypothetical protein
VRESKLDNWLLGFREADQKTGASDGIRTRDIQIHNLAL